MIKKFLSVLFIISLAAFWAVPFSAGAVYYSEIQKTLTRFYHIKTSETSDFYADITIENNHKFKIKGRFAPKTGYTLSKIQFNANFTADSGDFSVDITPSADGSFSTELVNIPKADSFRDNRNYSYIYFNLSGKYLSVRVEYDDIEKEWFFASNGISSKNDGYLNRAYDLPVSAVKSYISANGNYAETLAKIKTLANIAIQQYGGDNDYEKARSISKYIGKNFYYDDDASVGLTDESRVDINTVNLEFVFETNRAVCIGYANLFAAMCESVGVKALVLVANTPKNRDVHYDTANSTDEGFHNFNAFYANGKWHYADTLWDADVNTYSGGHFTSEGSRVPKHFDINSQVLAFSHKITRAERRDYFAVLSEPETTKVTTAATSATAVSITAPPLSQTADTPLPVINSTAATSNITASVISSQTTVFSSQTAPEIHETTLSFETINSADIQTTITTTESSTKNSENLTSSAQAENTSENTAESISEFEPDIDGVNNKKSSTILILVLSGVLVVVGGAFAGLKFRKG